MKKTMLELQFGVSIN